MISQSSMLMQEDKGLTPASGYYIQRSIQVSKNGPNENIAKIPNSLENSGQMRQDGTSSPYTNIGSSNDADSIAFLSFDISGIPKDAIIKDTALKFEGWDMVGTPFSKFGCLNIFPASYRLFSSQSYYSTVSRMPYGKICSSGQLNSPQSFADLTKAVQDSLKQGTFQVRLQFDSIGLDEESSQEMYKIYNSLIDKKNNNAYLSTGYISPGYSPDYLSPGYSSYSQ